MTQENNNIPYTRANLTPVSNILYYKITSTQMEEFVKQKAEYYNSGTSVVFHVQYLEKKVSRINCAQKAASVVLGFNENIIQKKTEEDIFRGMFITNENVKYVDSIFVNMIKKYQYDKYHLENIINNYKLMENIENRLGINQSFLKRICTFATPRVVEDNNGGVERRIILFAANPEKIIKDMLSDPETGEPIGAIEIRSIDRVSDNLYNWVVYVHPIEAKRNTPDIQIEKFMKELVK